MANKYAEALVRAFGLGPENIERINELISSSHSALAPASSYVTDRDLDEELQSLQQLSSQVVSGFPVPPGTISTRQIVEDFRFSTIPQARAAANAVAGIGQIVGNLLETQAEVQHGYGMLARSITQNVLMTASVAARVPGWLRAIRSSRWVLRGAKVLRDLGIVSANVAAGATAGSVVPGAGTAGGAIVGLLVGLAEIVAIEGASRAAYHIASRLAEDYAFRQAVKASGITFIDPSDVTAQYVARIPTGVSHEELQEVLESTRYRRSALEGGLGYWEGINALRDISIWGKGDSQFAEYALSFEATTGLNIIPHISRLSIYQPEIDESSKLFEEFFMSVVVDGKVHASQLSLVGELIGLREQLISNTVFFGDQADLGKIHSYLTPMFGNMHTVVPTAQIVTSLDDMLMAGVSNTNWHARMLMDRAGITSEEVLAGVGSDFDVFTKIMTGIHAELGFEAEDFEGGLSPGQMIQFNSYVNESLNMGLGPSRAMLTAYQGFVTGAPEREVHENLLEQLEGLDRGEGHSWFELTEQGIRGAQMLTDITLSYGDLLVKFQDAIVRFAGNFTEMYFPATQGVIDSSRERLERYQEGRQSNAREVTTSRDVPRPQSDDWLESFGGDSAVLTSYAGEIYTSESVPNNPELWGKAHQGVDVVLTGADKKFTNPFNVGMQYLGTQYSPGLGYTARFKNVLTGNVHAFSHLAGSSSMLGLAEGDVVAPGQALGVQGNTGTQTTGAHIHWNVDGRTFRNQQEWEEFLYSENLKKPSKRVRMDINTGWINPKGMAEGLYREMLTWR